MDSQTIDNYSKNSILVKTTNKSSGGDPTCAQITIKEFLNFLKTAYQVQESVEGVLMAGGMTEAVQWLNQKENQLLFKQKNTSCQTSLTEASVSKHASGSGDDKKDVIKKKSSTCNENDPLKLKLNEVLSEGLFDSVLPYLIQNSSSISRKSSTIKIAEKGILSNQSVNDKSVRRKSTDIVLSKAQVNKTDSEVEIHVCDEVKNTKKTFVCNQKLLVEKMGYFAEVTLGQRLEDMDISVHCDIGIFEWLMQWVKKDSLLEEDWPQLDPQCVIPILVSAAFLQMEPLLHDCLLFCHERMNEILRSSTNLSCLNDSVLTRLAAMYTNAEVESIRDRKDKIQSRLFSKLILSLAEPEPESVRGHWNSLASVFFCEKCQQLIDPSVALKIPCSPPSMRLQTDGSIISLHVRDPSWNINDYILKLHKTLKTWRKVYWRLWGDAHFLYCTTCKRYFPSNQLGWCRYHPDTPQFFTLDAQKAPLPIGRYPCCGERAYRFQLIENYSGCQFRQHFVNTEDVRDSAVYALLEAYRHLVEEEPPQLLFPERLTRLVARDTSAAEKKFVCKETFWWDGLEIIPPRPKLGLLSVFANRITGHGAESPPSEDSTDEYTEDESSSITTSNSDDGSAESNPTPVKKLAEKKKRKNKNESKLWQHNLSARTNQDIQRAYEENVLKEMTTFLNRKTTLSETIQRTKGLCKTNAPPGGLWMRLECEWREGQSNSQATKLRNSHTTTTKLKARGKFT